MKILLVILSFSFFFSSSPALALPTLRVSMGVSLTALDGAEAEDFVTIRVLMNLGQGLTRLSSDLKIMPGLAKSWTISENNKIYNFTLKKNFWSDGSPITASDFIKGFEHTLSPTTTSKLAAPLLEVIEGAKKYKTDQLQNFNDVGIKCIGDYQIQFKLTHPAPYFLSVLALPMTFPAPPKKGLWSGAYTLKSLSQEKIELEPNIKAESPAINALKFIVVKEASTALSLYLKKELDVIDKIPSEDYLSFVKNPELHSKAWLSTYYLGFNVSKPPFNDKFLRQAFIESINREQTVNLLRDAQKSSSSLVPTPLSGSDKNYGPPFNPVAAKNYFSSKEFQKNFQLDFDAQEKNNLIGARVQDDLKRSLGIDLKLNSMEWKSYLQYLKTSQPSFFRFAWLASFPDPLSHLQVFVSDNPNNYTGYKNPQYDDLVLKISQCVDLKERQKLIEEAQDILLTKDMVIMPLFHYIQHVLIGNRWQGLDLSPMGILYFHQAFQPSLP